MVFLFFLCPLVHGNKLFNGTTRGNNNYLNSLTGVIDGGSKHSLLVRTVGNGNTTARQLTSVFKAGISVVRTTVTRMGGNVARMNYGVSSSANTLLGTNARGAVALTRRLTAYYYGLGATVDSDTRRSRLRALHRASTVGRSINNMGDTMAHNFSSINCTLHSRAYGLSGSVNIINSEVVTELSTSRGSTVRSGVGTLRARLAARRRDKMVTRRVTTTMGPVTRTIGRVGYTRPRAMAIPCRPFRTMPGYMTCRCNVCGNNNGLGNF